MNVVPKGHGMQLFSSAGNRETMQAEAAALDLFRAAAQPATSGAEAAPEPHVPSVDLHYEDKMLRTLLVKVIEEEESDEGLLRAVLRQLGPYGVLGDRTMCPLTAAVAKGGKSATAILLATVVPHMATMPSAEKDVWGTTSQSPAHAAYHTTMFCMWCAAAQKEEEEAVAWCSYLAEVLPIVPHELQVSGYLLLDLVCRQEAVAKWFAANDHQLAWKAAFANDSQCAMFLMMSDQRFQRAMGTAVANHTAPFFDALVSLSPEEIAEAVARPGYADIYCHSLLLRSGSVSELLAILSAAPATWYVQPASGKTMLHCAAECEDLEPEDLRQLVVAAPKEVRLSRFQGDSVYDMLVKFNVDVPEDMAQMLNPVPKAAGGT